MIINRRHALLLTTLAFANAFAPPLWCPHQRAGFRQPSTTTQQWLYSNDEQDDGIDAMRMLLESSWNINTMGQVPINAEAAADAAVESLNSALDAASSMSTKSRVFFIDILLPQYDIRQGPKVYDEILATEFCIHLAKRLKGRSEILVRDDKTLAVVERVLSARERESQANDKDVDDASRDDSRQDEGDATVSVEQGSDDDSEGMQQKPSAGTPATDIESFRQQLITGWTEGKDMSDEISVASHRNRGFRGQKRTGSSVGKSLLNGPGMENFEDEEPDVRSYRQKAMAITTGMISVAVGLACAENFLYVFVLGGALGSANGEDDHKGDILQAWIVLFFRSIFPVHALAAAMQSINMIRKFVETTEDDGHRIGVGRIILPAVLLHGTFDAMLMGINVYIETSWDRYLEENDGNVGEDPPYNSIVVNTVAWMSITTIMIIGLVWYFVQNRRQSKRLAELEVVERIKLQNNAGTNGFSARQHVRLKTKNLEIV